MVLQVLPDAGKIDRHGDTVAAQLVGGAKTGQHQKLWRVEGTSSQDDLAGRSHLLLHPALRVADAVGTDALEPNAVHLRSELNREVRPARRGTKIGMCGGGAHPVIDVGLERAEP